MQWIDSCLKNCGNYPIIVVDNASTDETVSFIETNYPNIILLKQTKNLGFGQANNLGIRYALDHEAEHVFLLNQDAYLIDDVLEQLVTFQKAHSEYGILSPLHITRDKTKLDENFSRFMLSEKTGQFYSDFVLGNTLPIVYDVPFVNAAAWLISRKCLETVGGFDPLFFHYGEDENYCQRVAYHNFKIGVLPKVFVIHDRDGRTTPKISIYSPEYFKYTEKVYKIIYADITSENKQGVKEKKLKRTILKFLLRMKLHNARASKKELALLLKLKPFIEKSRNINKSEGSHYL